MSAKTILTVAAAALAGGVAAIGIGSAAGWLGGSETKTVVVERAVGTGEPAGAAVSAAPSRGGFDPAAIYRDRSAGVVTIFALFDGAGADVAQAQGSGFVISPEGYVLTNSHVITTAGEGDLGGEAQPASEVLVEFRDGDRLPASIVGWDVFSDVGLLEIDPAAHALSTLPLGDSAHIVVGEPVAAIGSPFGQAGSLAVGVVSATERAVSSLTSAYAVVDAIQIDAPINRGNSGGPLFNANGEVIGVNAQIRSESGNAEGVGFAIPINTARRSMTQLIENGTVEYAWAGVSTQTLTPSLADELGYSVDRGAAIQGVVPGSPAERAGLRAGGELVRVDGLEFRRGGDVIVAIDGQPVRSTEDLIRLVVETLVPGDEVEFTVVRDGRRLVVPVRVGRRPANPDPVG